MKKTLFATPQDAEAAFYEAFMKRDLEAMMAVWADDDEVYCVHPARRARHRRRAGARIVAADIRERAERCASRCASSNAAGDDGVGAQRLRAHRGRAASRARARCVIATNIYMRTERGWRMMVAPRLPAPRAVERGRAAAGGRRKTLHS